MRGTTMNTSLLSWLVWNPNREFFRIPYLDHPIMWYGVLFVTGLLLGYFQMIALLNYKLGNKEDAQRLTDKLMLYAIIGIVVGARLGHVFFYDFSHTIAHPETIFMVWKGGLASHGGTAGVLIALYFYCRSIQKEFPQLTFLRIVDMVTIPTSIVATFIRLGNFANQEILGTKSTVPWAIIFGNPYDGSTPTPRHPVVLYEALCYLICYFIVRHLWYKHSDDWKPGRILGVLLVWIYGTRFILEYFKEDLGHHDLVPFLQIGQLLSIPFILAGLILYFYEKYKKP
jgi:phosphatidylglycerol:prolipoprotein diacylglycerol transferase